MSRNQLATVTEEAPVETSMIPALAPNASLAVSLARAEVDQQIATARALPRQISRAVNNILALATLDDESAEECVYALPRAGKAIRGPSIRLAEIIASQWGNCRVGARVVHVDRIEKYVEAEGVFHDLETNTATTARVRRRLSDSRGRLLNDDMIVVTGNAACAIAKRNAILGAVPKAVWRRTFDRVEAVIAGDVETLVERRDRATKAFAAFGVTPEQICRVLEISGVDDLTADHLVQLTGMRSAIKSGEATVEEMFPAEKPGQGDAPKGNAARLDQLAGGSKPSSALAEQATADEVVDPDTGEVTKSKSPDPKGEGSKNDAAAGASEEAAGAGGVGGSAASSSDKGGEGGDEGLPSTSDPEGIDPDSPRGQLLAKLRAKAEKGPRALKLAIGGLSVEEQGLFTEADAKDLKAIADEAGAASTQS